MLLEVAECLFWNYLSFLVKFSGKSVNIYAFPFLICITLLHQVVQPPTDGVSSLSFSPKGNYLVATSWDNQVLSASSFWWLVESFVFGGIYISLYNSFKLWFVCETYQVRCWEVNTSGGSVPKASISHDQPVSFFWELIFWMFVNVNLTFYCLHYSFWQVLCSAWKDDGTTVFSAGCDKQAKMWPLMAGGQATTVAMHDAPIKELAWIPEMNVLVTGGWDKTLRHCHLLSSHFHIVQVNCFCRVWCIIV